MPNPFYYGGRIENPDYFVGRKAELQRIFNALETAHTGQVQHVSVVGPRRMGKSSLLYHVLQTYPQKLQNPTQYRFVYIDLSDPHCDSLPGLLDHILDGLHISHPAQPTLARFQETIQRLREKEHCTPVLCLDEFEHLVEKPQEFPEALYDAWRSLGANNQVAFLTASKTSLRELADQERLTSLFFNIFTHLPLKELPDPEARALIERGLDCDRPFSPEDCERLLCLAGNNPYKLQLAGSLLYQAKAEGNTDWKHLEAEYLQQENYIFAATPPPAKASFWERLKIATISVLRWPRHIGRFVLELANRKDFSETTALLVGYLLILLAVALLLGWLNVDLLKRAWRFFFPVE